VPDRPPQICRECQQVATSGAYCSAHANNNREINAARDRERERRAGGIRRLYDCAQWRNRTAPFILSRDPFCTIAIVCDGGAASTEVDHIVRADIYVAQHGGDLRSFYDASNLRGACHNCHSYKTFRENRNEWTEPAKG
jgi:5-methylcytosine-specific restriction protein A